MISFKRFLPIVLSWAAIGMFEGNVVSTAIRAEEPFQPRPGDLILTRNRDDFGNPTPGYWNHVGIVSTRETVVEAQKEFGLIATKTEAFFKRYPEYLVLRKSDSVAAFAAAKNAEIQWNRSEPSEYSAAASIRVRIDEFGDRDNCVSLVRRAYYSATGIDYRWKTPTQIYQRRRQNGFDVVYRHKNNDDWNPPQNFWEGMVEKN